MSGGQREKKEFLLRNRIAVWDVLYSCDIEGAKDTSIINPTPNKLDIILSAADIKGIFATAAKHMNCTAVCLNLLQGLKR